MKKVIVTEAQMEQMLQYEMIEQVGNRIIEHIENNMTGVLVGMEGVDAFLHLKENPKDQHYSVSLMGYVDEPPYTEGVYRTATQLEPEEYPEEMWQAKKFTITSVDDLYINEYNEFIDEYFEELVKYIKGKSIVINWNLIEMDLTEYKWPDND